MVLKELDFRSPRERVDDSLLGRLSAEDNGGDYYRSRSADDRADRSVGAWSSRSGDFGRGAVCPAGRDGGRSGAGQGRGEIVCVTDPARGKNGWGLKDFPLGMVYAPLQEWRGLFDLETAYSRGTLFRELDLPFTAYAGSGASGRGGYRG